MANVTDTEHFLRWVEAQPIPPKRFLFPTPLQAGVLAAFRLRFNVFHGQPLSPKGHEEKVCVKNGWLELRESEELALTKQGRAVLDAVVANLRMEVKVGCKAWSPPMKAAHTADVTR